MRQKTIEVPPYKHTFRVFNKALKEFSKEFEELFDAIDYVLKKDSNRRPYFWWAEYKFSFVLHSEAPVYRWGIRSKEEPLPAPLNVIINDIGEIVSKDDIRDAFNSNPYSKDSQSRRKYTNEVRKRLLRIKGSPNKIKQSCEHVPWYWRDEMSYSNRVLGNYARPGTLREKKDSEGHILEYGEGIVRGARRPRQLRDTYDDKQISMWGVQNSWKHHSKRRKQWIPK